MSRGLGGSSPVHRYLNGNIMEPQEAEATTGLLQHGSVGEDEEDGPAAGLASEQVGAAGRQLDASGTEVSLNASRQPQPVASVVNATKSTASLRTSWKLKYQDFVPERRHGHSNKWDPGSSEHFQKLVDRANDWLDKNRDVQVKTCQTMTWMSHDSKRLGSSELMVLSKNFSENSTTYYVRGLRLWVIPRTQPRRQQPIAFTDFSPDNPDETIQGLVDMVNKKIENKQLKGQILTMETFSVPVLNGKIDGRITRWVENVNDDYPYSFLLRVFHCRSADPHATGKVSNFSELSSVGIKDVVPMATEDGYEGFEDLIERTNTWLKDQSDILIIGMQSVMVQKSDNGPHCETGSACHFISPGINSTNPVDYFRILRVAYRKPPASAAACTDLQDLPVIYPFTYETFTPELVRVGGGKQAAAAAAAAAVSGSQKERLETMNETFSKVIAFLQNSGADVICAEMVPNPMQLYAEDNAHNLAGPDEIQFLLTIRLFLTGQISRVDGSIASIKRASIASCRAGARAAAARFDPTGARAGAAANGRDDSRPGPIFLRSVVTRQFKYRWLVLAISAFFCMAVIVTLSVVYSNR